MIPIVALCAVLAAGPAADEPVWTNASALTIEGRGPISAAEPFVRFPETLRATMPRSVAGLSVHSAGLAIRFRTAASEIHVRWSLTSPSLDMPHMPATGVSGLDLYRREPDRGWRYIGTGRPSRQQDNTAAFSVGPGGAREYRLYLPLYNGVSSLEIGAAAGAALEPVAPTPPEGRIVYYGTSIAQGGCASRPGMAHPTILGRMLEREVVNLGFSGSGRMDPEVAAAIADLRAAAYVIDCLWNMTDAEVTARLQPLVQALRKAHPKTPIVFVGQSHYVPEAHPTSISRTQAEAVRALRQEGVPGLYLIDGADLLGDDGEGTVDGCHPTDLGMMRHATALAPRLRAILDGKGGGMVQ